MKHHFVTDAERANWEHEIKHHDEEHGECAKIERRAFDTIAALLLELERNHINKHQNDPNYEDSHKCASRLCNLAAEVRGTK